MAEAKRLVKHYDFLKGHKFSVGNYQYPIDLILIAPSEQDRFGKFLELFNLHRDNEIALNNSGFNSKKLQIILLEDDIGGLQIYAELDSYLTKNNIAKVYTIGFSVE